MSEKARNIAVGAATAMFAGGVAVPEVMAQPNVAPSPSMAGQAIREGSFNSQPVTAKNSITAAELAPYTAGPPTGTDYPEKTTTTVVKKEVEMPMSPQYGASANAHVLSKRADEKVESFTDKVTEQIKAGSHLVSNEVDAHASDDAANTLNGGAKIHNVDNENLSHVRAHTMKEAEDSDFKALGMHVKTEAHGDEKIRKTIEHELAKLGKKEGKTVQEIIAGVGERTPAEQKILDKYTKDRGATATATFEDVSHQPPAEQLSPPFVGHNDTPPVVHHDNPMIVPEQVQVPPAKVYKDAQYGGQILSHKAEAKEPEVVRQQPRPFNGAQKSTASRTRARQHGNATRSPRSVGGNKG
jgi:hypothetical protein